MALSKQDTQVIHGHLTVGRSRLDTKNIGEKKKEV
jgi:hypothetical protein